MVGSSLVTSARGGPCRRTADDLVEPRQQIRGRSQEPIEVSSDRIVLLPRKIFEQYLPETFDCVQRRPQVVPPFLLEALRLALAWAPASGLCCNQLLDLAREVARCANDALAVRQQVRCPAPRPLAQDFGVGDQGINGRQQILPDLRQPNLTERLIEGRRGAHSAPGRSPPVLDRTFPRTATAAAALPTSF